MHVLGVGSVQKQLFLLIKYANLASPLGSFLIDYGKGKEEVDPK